MAHVFNAITRKAEAGSVEAILEREHQERQGYLEKPSFGDGESAVLIGIANPVPIRKLHCQEG